MTRNAQVQRYIRFRKNVSQIERSLVYVQVCTCGTKFYLFFKRTWNLKKLVLSKRRNRAAFIFDSLQFGWAVGIVNNNFLLTEGAVFTGKYQNEV